MAKLVRASDLKLSEADRQAIATRYGLRTLEPLGGFENVMLRSTNPEGFIVRVTHTSRRSAEQVLGEFEYVEHLQERGVPVANAVRAKDGSLASTYTTEAGEDVIVACMVEAPGKRRPPADWSEADMEAYGRALGLLHQAAADFEPSNPAYRRPPWYDPRFDPGFSEAAPALRKRFRDIIERTRALPAGGTGLLIHQDAHHGNLHLTEDSQLTLFDFDDCGYGTATHDLAICFFYRFYGAEDIRPSALRPFINAFLRGYQKILDLPADWPRGVDCFLALREVELLFLVRDFPGKRPIDERFLQRAEAHLHNDKPFLEEPTEEWAMPTS